MNATALRYLKAGVATVVLIVLVITVRGWWNEYRSASVTSPSGETTQSVSSVDTDSPPAAKGEGEKTAEPADATPAAGTVIVLIDGLNFRLKPEADAKPIRGLRKGEKMTLLSEKSGWLEVRSSDGTKGWVSSNPNYTEVKRR